MCTILEGSRPDAPYEYSTLALFHSGNEPRKCDCGSNIVGKSFFEAELFFKVLSQTHRPVGLTLYQQLLVGIFYWNEYYLGK